jgi:hypothetical protein
MSLLTALGDYQISEEHCIVETVMNQEKGDYITILFQEDEKYENKMDWRKANTQMHQRKP